MSVTRHALIRSLFDEYIQMYAARDERLISRFSDNFSGFAGGGDCLVTNRQEWIDVTRYDFSQIPDPIRIEMLDISLQDLSDDVVSVTAFFHIHLPIPEHILSREIARLTLIFRLEDKEWMIAYSGISIPYHLVQNGEVYPVKNLTERNAALEREVTERTLELKEANLKLEQFSNTDCLTGITNRRGFDNALIQEWSRAQRTGLPLSLIMIDVDYFKYYNDSYGHLAGDDCLRKIATAIREQMRRAGDIAARVGGDEFATLMPATNEGEVLNVARRIENSVAALSLTNSDAPIGRVTLSIGVASVVPIFGQDPESLIALADAALYRAKALGRNGIAVANSKSPEITCSD